MHNGFYDDDLEFVQLEHVQIVSSMAPASTLGRHPLATRLTANLVPDHIGTVLVVTAWIRDDILSSVSFVVSAVHAAMVILTIRIAVASWGPTKS